MQTLNGDHALECLEDYIPWARRVANAAARRIPAELREDAVSEGMIGLVQAWERFDGDRGAFKAYAYRRISGAVVDFSRSGTRATRKCYQMFQTREFLREEWGRYPSVQELANETGIRVRDVEHYLRSGMGTPPLSLSEPRNNGDKSDESVMLVDTIVAEDGRDWDLDILIEQMIEIAEKEIAKFHPREQILLRGWYLENKSLRQLAPEVGLAVPTASQIRIACGKLFLRRLLRHLEPHRSEAVLALEAPSS